MILKRVLLLISILALTSVQASEIDSFTGRYEPLEDALPGINKIANKYMDKAIAKTNEKSHGCNEKKLYKNIRKYFRNHMQGKVTKAVLKDASIDKRFFYRKDSIYQDFNWYQAFVLVVVGSFYKDAHGAVMKMGPHLIGSDKLEHLFGRGYAYFKRHYLRGQSLDKVTRVGAFQERWQLGSKTTGVYSYADLAANLNGLRLWNHFLQKRDDFLGKEYNVGPLIDCDNGEFFKVKEMDLAPFIDDAMDEGINCSKFSTKGFVKKVLRRIDDLEATTGMRHHCPVQDQSISILTEKYGPKLAPKVLNFSGHTDR